MEYQIQTTTGRNTTEREQTSQANNRRGSEQSVEQHKILRAGAEEERFIIAEESDLGVVAEEW